MHPSDSTVAARPPPRPPAVESGEPPRRLTPALPDSHGDSRPSRSHDRQERSGSGRVCLVRADPASLVRPIVSPGPIGHLPPIDNDDPFKSPLESFDRECVAVKARQTRRGGPARMQLRVNGDRRSHESGRLRIDGFPPSSSGRIHATSSDAHGRRRVGADRRVSGYVGRARTRTCGFSPMSRDAARPRVRRPAARRPGPARRPGRHPADGPSRPEAAGCSLGARRPGSRAACRRCLRATLATRGSGPPSLTQKPPPDRNDHPRRPPGLDSPGDAADRRRRSLLASVRDRPPLVR